ncbi:FAD-binding protein [Vulcanimicrobium alpinum]|uniref:FAD-binding protein n=1 Tax=Vulcanimicrobium alpinum TaxID=3016050 RepID=A0AAN1XWN0_UNVUL|nr:FAD-linked oxidase C-terminal domain-containing protein [Vulcanimicrobium alpinum]BDE05693.1 FAD-binding protein [Vulcanimicrobium alpinum]
MIVAAAPAATMQQRFARIVGERNAIAEPNDLRTYECDGLLGFRVRPAIVVLPESTDEVAACVRLARELDLPIVPRGAGTGLSGGALPTDGCVMIGLSRMKQILAIDYANRTARVQPGVINLDITRALAPQGYYYAPDPSSQSVCTIGGNIAENAGGAHCLKYGFTTNHVLGVTMVLGDGSVVHLGSRGGELDTLGYDLVGVVVGSEGMTGIVTEALVRIMRAPERTQTLFATFPTTDEAGDAVGRIIGAGIVPAAIEMCDKLAIEAIVAATHVDWPLDVGALLLMDVDGVDAEVEATAAQARAHLAAAGAIEIREPKDDAERALAWKGRKAAFAAVGRISPNYHVQDGVIPRKDIAPVLREIAALGAASGLRIANVFHAGDGNLHPLVLYDARIPGQEHEAERVAGEILRVCLRYGGSVTGEHGVGHDKACYLGEQFNADDLGTMQQVRSAFDPEHRFNPDKVFPTPRLCGDKPGAYTPHASELSGEAGRG